MSDTVKDPLKTGFQYTPPTVLEFDVDEQLRKEAERETYGSKGKFGQWFMRNQQTIGAVGGTAVSLFGDFFNRNKTENTPAVNIGTPPAKDENPNKKMFIAIGIAIVLVVLTIIIIKKRK